MDTDVMSPASTLCTACGMCCDGTLFRCRLLKKLDVNEITLPDAMDKIRMTRALQASLQASLPLAGSAPLSIQEVRKIYHDIDQMDQRQRQQQAVF
jgi:hypothetical protein